MNIHIQCGDSTWQQFKQKVGEGNASQVLRDFMDSYNDSNQINIQQKKIMLIREMSVIKPTYETYLELKAQLDEILSKERMEELQAIQKEKKQQQNLANAIGEGMKDNLWRILQ